MLTHGSITVVLQGTEVVRGPGLIPVPVVALVAVPFDLPGHALGEEDVLILRIVVPPSTNYGAFDSEFPSPLLGEVLPNGCVKLRMVQSVLRQGGYMQDIPSPPRPSRKTFAISCC